MRSRFCGWVPLAALMAAACGGDSTSEPSPSTTANCDSPVTVTLSPGGHAVLGLAASSGCVRLPAAGSGGATYFMALVSGAGGVTQSGVSGPYALRMGNQGSLASAPAPVPPAAASTMLDQHQPFPTRFHLALRERERELSAQTGNRLAGPAVAPALAPPVEGTERTFKVCKNLSCSQFDSVAAVARVVEQKTAIYLDKVVPTFDTLTQADLEDLARTFNTYHYPFDTNAFGAESDKDANGVVIILLTDAVNALTPDCTNGRILGFFWGGDLLDVNGSNRSELFYGMVPAPATATCTAAKRQDTLDRLKPTLIHELQHMISFNQHALVRTGPSEATWLNEALSHFAEELGGRLIPNSECVGFSSCRSQYISGDLFNAYDYLGDTENVFLVTPSSSNGTLEERGAGYLFIRWLADQFGTDSLGTNTTRALVQTSQTGATNVASATGQDFPTSVAEWQLAVYTDDLSGFTPASLRLTYKSWGYRKVFQDNCCVTNAPFAKAFPMEPVLVSGFPFLRTGTLRGGTGQHFQVAVPAGGQGVDVLVSRTSGGPPIDPALEARLAIVRLP